MQFDARLYQHLLDGISDGVYFTDRDRVITYWNTGSQRLTGYTAEEVLGTRCADNILMHVDDQGRKLCEGQCPLADVLADGQSREAQVYLHHKDGHRVPVHIRVSPVRDDGGEIVGAVALFSDSTVERAQEERLAQLQRTALVDTLTELGNRRHAEHCLRKRLGEFERYGWTFGVLFLDIDHLKSVNDIYGHEVGDKALRMVARTLAGNVRSFDVVARWGGDEIVIIVANVSPDQLTSVAHKLRALVEQSALPLGETALRLTVSIGVTIMGPDDTAATIMKRADDLMYRSKAAGCNRVTSDALQPG